MHKKLNPMKTMTFLFGVVLFIYGCSKEELKVTDPRQAILGKWKLIENDFGPISYPNSYDEYLPDSILTGRNTNGDIYVSKYWMNDSILFVMDTYYIDEGPGFEDTITVILPYRYEFLSYNRLQLDFQNPAIVTKIIYKRIK